MYTHGLYGTTVDVVSQDAFCHSVALIVYSRLPVHFVPPLKQSDYLPLTFLSQSLYIWETSMTSLSVHSSESGECTFQYLQDEWSTVAAVWPETQFSLSVSQDDSVSFVNERRCSSGERGDSEKGVLALFGLRTRRRERKRECFFISWRTSVGGSHSISWSWSAVRCLLWPSNSA